MKFRKILLLAAAASTLSGCDFLFGPGDEEGEADGTLYKLTLSYSSNVASKEGFTQDKLTTTLCFGDERTSQRSTEEIEDLKNAGATDEDIAKAGVRQSDGTYYFFGQDPMYINTPNVEGYYLNGLFYKGTNNLAYRPGESQDSDGVTRPRRWNMDAKNVELEARYQVLQYAVTYVYSCDYSGGPSGVMPGGSHSNPSTFNYETNPNVALTAPTATFEGFEFKYWCYLDANRQMAQTTKLLNVYDEEVFHPTVTQTSIDIPEFVIWAHYDRK